EDDHHETALAPEAEIDEVKFRPMTPRPSLFQPLKEDQRIDDSQDEALKPFIPPLAERPVRAPRMPRIDELPLPGQNELRAHRGEATEGSTLETKRMTLLQRLANIGMSQKPAAEEKAEGGAELPSFLKARETASTSESVAKPADRKPPEVSEYFKRPV